MAANKDKITAADIFDQGIKGSYEQFILLNKQAAKSVTDLKREIIKMNNAMKKGGSTLSNRKAVTTATTKQAKATKDLTKATNNLTQAQNKNAKARQAQITGFARLGSGIKNLLGAAGIAGLSLQLVRLAQDFYTTAKALDSMSLALRSVTDDTYELANAKAFLSKTTDRLGINILKTAKRYGTFLAAAKQSNLTMGETNEIFETFANVGAKLALTSDEMGGIFLALEQMLSKGKISTEELRRQLGERLPGAFGIMADAVGVTTQKLDEMLRKGELMTAEYLPKFAEEVEKVFSVDKTERVETMAAAQERLSNAWINLIETTSKDGTAINTILQTTLGLFEGILLVLQDMFDIAGEVLKSDAVKSLEGEAKALASAYSNIYDEMSKSEPGVQRFMAAMENIAVINRRLNKDLVGLGDGEKKSIIDFVSKTDITDREEIIKQLDILTGNLSRDQQKMIRIAIFQNQTFRKIADENADLVPSILMGVKDEKDRAKIIKRAEEDINEVGSRIKKLLEDEVKKLEKTAQELKDKLQLYPNDAEAKKELDAIEETLKGFYSRLGAIQSGGFFEPINILKRSPTYKEPKSIHETESYFKKRDAGEKDPITGKITGEVTGLQATSENINKSLQVAQEAYGYIADLENAQFERRMEQLEEETNAINEKYDTLERLALGDDELTQKLAIRREEELKAQRKKEKKLEYDAAKAKKKQSLIDAAINIALAITSALTAAPPASWIGAGVAAALGAVQLATIAAAPLPAYAEGTDNHPGGLAMLGDGGKNEIALHPDGTVYMSGDTPEVVDLPKGSQVMADAKDYINQQVIKAIIDTDKKMDEIVVDKITEAVHKGFKSVKINNNNINNNNLDFQMWRNTLLNGN